MAQDNIYDYTVSELILRLDAATGTDSYTANLIINNSLGQDTIEASSSTNNVTFTSTVINFPSGYSVKANTHILTFPIGSPITTSGSVSSGTTTMILGAIPSTFVVTSSVTLEHATSPDIVLAGSQTITAVLPIYYGVKPFEVTPDVTSLEQISSSVTTFDLTSTSLGRLNIVIPTSTGTMLSVTDDNGLIIPSSDFLKTTITGFDYYVLIYDTQLTGTNLKTFTINYV